MTEPDRTERLGEALGASRVVDLGRHVGGPLDLLALRREVALRLRSSGGRPTDPDWTIARQVPFKEESWKRLQELADEVGTKRRRVGAAQLAAMLVEYGLDEVETERWADILEVSRTAPLLTASDAANAAAISFRQLDAWRKEGVITPARVEARRRWFTIDAVVRMIWLRTLSNETRGTPTLKSSIAGADLSARYLVTSNDAATTVATRGEVLRLLAEEGFLRVIDQMPLRLRLLGGDDDPRERRDGRGEAKAV